MPEQKLHTNFILRSYLKLKYSFLGKFTQLSPRDSRQKGLVLIQIDGISFPAMMKAMSSGYLPTIRRLVNKRGYALLPYFCPMPSNTPYVQAGIMYGNNSGIPGFRWLEKKDGFAVSFKDAYAAATVEERVSGGRPGILTGGSSYVNLYTGGAERSVFTLSTFAASNILKKKVSHLDIFILFIIYVTNLVRTALYLLLDSTLEFFEWLYLLISRKKRRSEGIFPLIRLINNIIFREVETAGAMTDIMRGVPSVYLTFNGYDEMSHHRGPEFSGAFRTLRGIDRKVNKILMAVESCRKRDYDVYIFSDHGQTPSTPFAYRYGETLADLLQRTTPEELEITEFHSPQEVVLYEGWKYMEELGFLTLNLPRLFYNIFEKIRSWLADDEARNLPFMWGEEREQVSVCDSGPLSHIYFNFKDGNIPASEIENKYPELMNSLMSHPGIGVIVGRDEGGEAAILKWDENLKYSDRDLFIALAGEESSGDVILQGAFDGEEIINFEEQLSGHGGVGGGQNSPFFLLPPGCSLDLAAIKNPRDFYSFFFETYTKHVIKETDE